MMANRAARVAAMSDDSDPERSLEVRNQQRALARKTLPALVVAGLLIAFGVANDGKVKINWLVFSTRTSLILVIAVSALLGALIGGLIVLRRKR